MPRASSRSETREPAASRTFAPFRYGIGIVKLNERASGFWNSALSNGTTTLIGGGTGPSDGSNATTVTAGPGNIRNMLRAFEGFPVNTGILGKGHGHGKAALVGLGFADGVDLHYAEYEGATAFAVLRAPFA